MNLDDLIIKLQHIKNQEGNMPVKITVCDVLGGIRQKNAEELNIVKQFYNNDKYLEIK